MNSSSSSSTARGDAPRRSSPDDGALSRGGTEDVCAPREVLQRAAAAQNGKERHGEPVGHKGARVARVAIATRGEGDGGEPRQRGRRPHVGQRRWEGEVTKGRPRKGEDKRKRAVE